MTLHHGDCLEVMAQMPESSVDAIATDPPYNLTGLARGSGTEIMSGVSRGFMGKAWDGTGVAFDPATWGAMLRVARPGAYLLAFGGTRTYHRMVVAIEDAGWLIRDCLVWAYASGFPKSKALLKPAWEPIVMARKPGPLRDLAIDDCRIPFVSADEGESKGKNEHTRYANPGSNRDSYSGHMPPRQDYDAEGRWPANVILTDPIFDGDTQDVIGGGIANAGAAWTDRERGDGPGILEGQTQSGRIQLAATTYSRFFLIPKAKRADKEPSFGAGLEPKDVLWSSGTKSPGTFQSPNTQRSRLNHHPTVKPVELMRHLVRLVTPRGGTVLDPFLGSGTTAIAAEMEGFAWIGIEREAEYVAIAEARLQGVQRGMGLSA